MMPGQRLPAGARRKQIAAAALRILATRGVEALTLAGLSAEVGIADASILRHLPSKQAIIDAAIDAFTNALDQDLNHGVEDPVERLRDFFVRRLQRVRAQPELLPLAFNTRLQDVAGQQGARRVRRTTAASVRFIRDCVVEAQQGGQFDAGIPPELLVWTVIGVVRGAALGLPAGPRSTAGLASRSPEEIFEQLQHLLLSRGPAPASTAQVAARRRRSKG